MKKRYFSLMFFGLFSLKLISQTIGDLIRFNQAIDNAVIAKDTIFLSSAYSDDYVFTHGTGLVDSKQSWISAVKRNTYLLRQHDSVQVESHKPSVFILFGTLTVKRMDKSNLAHYALQYVRIYTKIKKRLQMVSHRTTKEWHLN